MSLAGPLALLGIKGIACHGYAPEQTLTFNSGASPLSY